MNKTQYLNEEKYNKTKKRLQIAALIILIIGIIVGGLLLYKGINTEKVDINALKVQKNEEFEQNGFSEKYYELQEQIDRDDPKYVFIGIGIVVLLISGVSSLIIYIISKQREINAFYVQQQMPIAQEGIEKMAPSAGVAAKEIAKGIKEGLNDEAK